MTRWKYLQTPPFSEQHHTRYITGSVKCFGGKIKVKILNIRGSAVYHVKKWVRMSDAKFYKVYSSALANIAWVTLTVGLTKTFKQNLTDQTLQSFVGQSSVETFKLHRRSKFQRNTGCRSTEGPGKQRYCDLFSNFFKAVSFQNESTHPTKKTPKDFLFYLWLTLPSLFQSSRQCSFSPFSYLQHIHLSATPPLTQHFKHPNTKHTLYFQVTCIAVHLLPCMI